MEIYKSKHNELLEDINCINNPSKENQKKIAKFSKKYGDELSDILLDNTEEINIISKFIDDKIEYYTNQNKSWDDIIYKLDMPFKKDDTPQKIKFKKMYDLLIEYFELSKNLVQNSIENDFNFLINNEEKKINENLEDYEIIEEENLEEENIEEEILPDLTNLRPNQEHAINTVIEQGYKCGIINQIMGSGKTYEILNLIEKHYDLFNESKSGNYMILCSRKDVLLNIFYTHKGKNEYEINNNELKKLKQSKIITIDKYNLVNFVNDDIKTKEIKNDKPNIIIINTAYMCILFEKKDVINKIFSNTQLLLFDECHSNSAPKMYKILQEFKYNYKKPIIGFSATPLRDIKNAEAQMRDIFSDSYDKEDKNKNVNIISTYDLFEAIKDGIILPFKHYLYEIKDIVGDEDKKLSEEETIKNSKFNEKVFEEAFKEILNTSILPYKKIVCWCRDINGMNKWYEYAKKLLKDENYKLFKTDSKPMLVT